MWPRLLLFFGLLPAFVLSGEGIIPALVPWDHLRFNPPPRGPPTKFYIPENVTVQHGWCGVHIREIFGDPNPNATRAGNRYSGWFNVTVFDASKQPIGSVTNMRFSYKKGISHANLYKQITEVPSLLPRPLVVDHPRSISPIRNKDMSIHFTYDGDDWWSYDKERCRVGQMDYQSKWRFWVAEPVLPRWTRDMDCGFEC